MMTLRRICVLEMDRKKDSKNPWKNVGQRKPILLNDFFGHFNFVIGDYYITKML